MWAASRRCPLALCCCVGDDFPKPMPYLYSNKVNSTVSFWRTPFCLHVMAYACYTQRFLRYCNVLQKFKCYNFRKRLWRCRLYLVRGCCASIRFSDLSDWMVWNAEHETMGLLWSLQHGSSYIRLQQKAHTASNVYYFLMCFYEMYER